MTIECVLISIKVVRMQTYTGLPLQTLIFATTNSPTYKNWGQLEPA